MASNEDVYGEAIHAHHAGEESFKIVERDDGYIGPPDDPELYFSLSDEWAEREHVAMDRAEGRVLDVGCGAGRHPLYLQEQGHEVVGIDNSASAVTLAAIGASMLVSVTWPPCASLMSECSTRW